MVTASGPTRSAAFSSRPAGSPTARPRARKAPTWAYAAGLDVGRRDGHDWATHNGAQGPFRGTTSRLLDLGLAAAVLCNRSDAATEALAGQVLTAVAPEVPFRAPAAQRARPVPTTPVGPDFLGSYRSDELGATYAIAELEGEVRVRVAPDGGAPALPLGGEFGAISTDTIGNGWMTLRLRRAPDGRVTGLTAATPNVLALDLDRIRP